MSEHGSRSEMSSGWRTALKKPGVAEASGWILRVVDASGELLGSLDTYHHPDTGQILTTTKTKEIDTYMREFSG